MHVLVTGAAGMLGGALVRAFTQAGHRVTGTTRADLDVRSLAACRQAMGAAPDPHGDEAPPVHVVVNAAAWTDVDGAESDERPAYAVNATGAANLAVAAREVGARLVQISTDYVFDGSARTPYAEDAPLSPLGAYGRTKAAGEWAVRAEHPDALVVRTAWLYGPGGSNFVSTMARLAGERETLDVVDDQRGQPTTTRDVAVCVLRLLQEQAPAGIYHATSDGETTWCGLARAVFEELGLDAERVRPTTSERFPRPAPRPAYSVLGHERARALGIELPAWRDALADTVTEIL